MSERTLALTASLVLASLSIACGEKGDGTVDQTGGSAGTFSSGGSLPGAGGSGVGTGGSGGDTGGSGGTATGEETIKYGFDEDAQGFDYEIYPPSMGADGKTYTNIGEGATIEWSDGEGSDMMPGLIELGIPFAAPNELADIQLEPMPLEDWSGKIVRARVKIVSGFSPDPSAPGGAYIFVKTGADWVWGKGPHVNLPPDTMGTWQTLMFDLADPEEANDPFDPSQIAAVGIQFFSGAGSDVGLPEATVAHVDQITLQ